MDLEKIAAAMMQNATIQNVHFNDIHDNQHVYVGSEGVTTAEEQKEPEAKAEAEEKPSCEEALLPFILNDEERSKIAKALSVCTDTGQVAVLARSIYMEEILTSETLRSADFHRVILPHLTFKTSEAALRQAIQKQVK